MPNPIYVRHPRTRELMNLSQLSEVTGLHPATLTRRYRQGLRGEDLIQGRSSAQDAVSAGKILANARKRREKAQRRKLGLQWYSRQFDRKTKAFTAPTLGDVGRVWKTHLQEIMGA